MLSGRNGLKNQGNFALCIKSLQALKTIGRLVMCDSKILSIASGSRGHPVGLAKISSWCTLSWCMGLATPTPHTRQAQSLPAPSCNPTAFMHCSWDGTELILITSSAFCAHEIFWVHPERVTRSKLVCGAERRLPHAGIPSPGDSQVGRAGLRQPFTFPR